MAAKFRGKFLDRLEKAWRSKELVLAGDAAKLRNSYEWNEFRDSLYKKKWVVHVKETFNGKGNAIEYLGRYAHKIAISNSRIRSVSENEVLFTARGADGTQSRTVSLTPEEFVRRFLLHILAQGFRQSIQKYKDMANAEIIYQVWGMILPLVPAAMPMP